MPWWRALVVVSPVLGIIVSTDIFLVARVLGTGFPVLVQVLIGLAIAAVVFAMIAIGFRLRTPTTWIDAAGGRIRVGRRSADFAEIVECRLLVSVSRRRRTLSVQLRTSSGLRAGAVLRDNRDHPLPAADTAALDAAIRGSNIAMPVSRDDPKGRFARYNFPENVTKDEALLLVNEPPGFADALPTSPLR